MRTPKLYAPGKSRPLRNPLGQDLLTPDTLAQMPGAFRHGANLEAGGINGGLMKQGMLAQASLQHNPFGMEASEGLEAMEGKMAAMQEMVQKPGAFEQRMKDIMGNEALDNAHSAIGEFKPQQENQSQAADAPAFQPNQEPTTDSPSSESSTEAQTSQETDAALSSQLEGAKNGQESMASGRNAQTQQGGEESESTEKEGGASGGPQQAPPPADTQAKPRRKGGNTTGLPDVVKAKMERLTGMDLSGMKVKANSSFATKNKAKALIKGSELHFAPGQFNPGSQQGQQLIGHELAHVKQQAQGKVQALTQNKAGKFNQDASLEAEADQMAQQMMSMSLPEDGLNMEDNMDLLTPQFLNGEIIQKTPDPIAEYNELVAWATSEKERLTQKVTTDKESLTQKGDEQKQALTDMVTTSSETLSKAFDDAIQKITELSDQAKTDIETHRQQKIDEINTLCDTEVEKVNTLVQTKQETVTQKGQERSDRITQFGEAEGNRGKSTSLSNGDRLNSEVNNQASGYSDREGIDEARTQALEEANTLKDEFVAQGDLMYSSVTEEVCRVSEEITQSATEVGQKFNEPATEAIDAINKKRQEAVESLQTSGQEVIDGIAKEAGEVQEQLQTEKTKQVGELAKFPEGANETIDKAISDAHGVLEREGTKVAGEIDQFMEQISEIFWHSESMQEAKGDLQTAIQSYEEEMTGFMEQTTTPFAEHATQLQAELDSFIEEVNTILDELKTNFETETTSAVDQTKAGMDEVKTDVETEVTQVASNMEPKLDESISEAESEWDENIEDKEEEVTEKVDEGLEEQESVISDFSSDIGDKFDELPSKDRSAWDAFWSGVGDVFSFIGGMLVGIGVGFVNMLKGIASIFTSWVSVLIALVVIGLVIAIIAGIAALLGVAFGTVALIIGAIVGVVLLGYYIYLAVTTPGLSPYERGLLVGQGLFEAISGFIGTGLLGKLMGWAPKIAKLAAIASKIGGASKMLVVLTKVDDAARFLKLVEGMEDAASLVRLIDKVDDAKRIMDLVEAAGDAGQLISTLSQAKNLRSILQFADDPARLLSLVDEVGDINKVDDLLRAFGSMDELENVIRGVGGMEKFQQFQQIFPDPAVLRNLVSKVDDPAQLERLVGYVHNGDDLGRMLDLVGGDANKLESVLSQIGVRDADGLGRLLNNAGGDVDELLRMVDELHTQTLSGATNYLDNAAALGLGKKKISPYFAGGIDTALDNPQFLTGTNQRTASENLYPFLQDRATMSGALRDELLKIVPEGHPLRDRLVMAGDHPGNHAEIEVLNQLLWNRHGMMNLPEGQFLNPQVMSEMLVDIIITKGSRALREPGFRCTHCRTISENASFLRNSEGTFTPQTLGQIIENMEMNAEARRFFDMLPESVRNQPGTQDALDMLMKYVNSLPTAGGHTH